MGIHLVVPDILLPDISDQAMFTTTDADESGCSSGKNPVLETIVSENTREFPELITSTAAKNLVCFNFGETAHGGAKRTVQLFGGGGT